MKKIFLIAILILVTTSANASFYIFNSENRCIARTDYLPDTKDLQSRDEFYIEAKEFFDIMEIEYINGKIKDRVKSQAEKNAEVEAEEIAEEQKVLNDKIKDMAIDALQDDGVSLKHIKK